MFYGVIERILVFSRWRKLISTELLKRRSYMLYNRLIVSYDIDLYNVYPAAKGRGIILLETFRREYKIFLFCFGYSGGRPTVLGVLRQSASGLYLGEDGPVSVKGYYVYLSVRGAVVPFQYNVTDRQQILARRALAALTEALISVDVFHYLSKNFKNVRR